MKILITKGEQKIGDYLRQCLSEVGFMIGLHTR